MPNPPNFDDLKRAQRLAVNSRLSFENIVNNSAPGSPEIAAPTATPTPTPTVSPTPTPTPTITPTATPTPTATINPINFPLEIQGTSLNVVGMSGQVFDRVLLSNNQYFYGISVSQGIAYENRLQLQVGSYSISMPTKMYVIREYAGGGTAYYWRVYGVVENPGQPGFYIRTAVYRILDTNNNTSFPLRPPDGRDWDPLIGGASSLAYFA